MMVALICTRRFSISNLQCPAAQRNLEVISVSHERAHLTSLPRTRASVRHCSFALVGDELREEVGKDAEKRQTRNSVSRENPRSAAFVRMLCGRGLLGIGRDDWGPIFHTRPPDGKIVAQIHYASRLLCISAKQDHMRAILRPENEHSKRNCDQNHGTNVQKIMRNVTIMASRVPAFSTFLQLPAPR
jgi:hypothetical protein